MKRPIYYCKSWFRAKKKPTELWSEETAEAAHRTRRPYTVLVGSVEQPYCFVDVADNVVVVGFLDSHLRESLTYAFKEVEPGTLFLSMAIYREFVDEADKVANGATYTFGQDGMAQVRHEFFQTRRVEAATSSFDPALNCVVKPAFGQYEDLVRVERR